MDKVAHSQRGGLGARCVAKGMIGALRFARGAGVGAPGFPRNTIFWRVVRDLLAMAPLYLNPGDLHLTEPKTAALATEKMQWFSVMPPSLKGWTKNHEPVELFSVCSVTSVARIFTWRLGGLDFFS